MIQSFNMDKNGHLIASVDPGSIADQLGIEAGDILLSINDDPIEDIFDYQYKLNNETVTAVVLKKNGEEWDLDIENDYQDLGLNFENGLMSDYRSCSNNCIFCFIDQMPPGMRDTLYFKDDDSRLSFLQGNYVTLTNMKEHDLQRIIKFKLAPINISVHTTNPELRVKMLHNRFAGEALKKIDTLYEAGTPMNGQIVLCPGVNDGKELDRTIGDLTKYLPHMRSVSVVPVGLSKYRDGLCHLTSFTKETAAAAIDQIERWQKLIYPQYGVHFIHASDEFYLIAGRPLPEADRYDGYIQYENGVGMLRLLKEETDEALEELSRDPDREAKEEVISIATAKLAYPFIREISEKFMKICPEKKIHVYLIENDFFGHMITVAGLLTGKDLIAQLKGKEIGSRLLLTTAMFRSGEEVFLDDVTKSDVERELGVRVDIIPEGGDELIRAMSAPYDGPAPMHGEYEPDEGEFIEYEEL
nr:DUF512 domain-containing protein [[Clostridium] aminophilum]